MLTKVFRRMMLIVVVAPLAVLFVGCSGADNPKIADAPAYTPEPDTKAAKIPGRKGVYGAGSKYQKAMEGIGGEKGSGDQ